MSYKFQRLKQSGILFSTLVCDDPRSQNLALLSPIPSKMISPTASIQNLHWHIIITMYHNSFAWPRAWPQFAPNFCSWIKLGNIIWKYCETQVHKVLQLVKQVSVEKISSGWDHSSNAIIDTPLCRCKNFLHHNKSCLNDSGIGNLPTFGKPLKNSNILNTNNLPGLAQPIQNSIYQ